MILAEAILSKRLLQIKNEEYGFRDTDKGKGSFFAYFERHIEKKKGSEGNWGNWDSVLFSACTVDDILHNATGKALEKLKAGDSKHISLSCLAPHSVKRMWFLHFLQTIVSPHPYLPC